MLFSINSGGKLEDNLKFNQKVIYFFAKS